MNEVVTINEPAPVEHDELIRVLQSSLYPGAKPESIELVMAYCRANHLDVMLKPVHIVPTSVKAPDGTWKTIDVLMPGIADYRIKAARSGQYGGKSEPEFGPDVTATLGGVSVTYPAWCRVTVRRIIQGEARDFPAKERWLENYATAKRDSEAPNRMWLKRPYGQLAKCCEAQALRMAFPEFSAGYTAEEMEGRAIENFTGPTIESTASDARQAINDAVPLRAAAAPMPRGARIAEKAPAYEAEPKPERMSWAQWADSLEVAARAATTTAERGKVLARAEVTEIVRLAKQGAYSPAKARIIQAVEEIEAAYLADPPAPPEPEAEGLGEVEIAGSEKMAAGD